MKYNPKIKTKVVHSETKSAWNVVGISLGAKFKIARVPYLSCGDEEAIVFSKIEAHNHAQFISDCFNNSGAICKALNAKHATQ